MTGYHALTWGFIMGELVRRATGRTLAEVLRTQIAGPLRMAAPAFSGTDQVMGFPARWALGYSPARLGSTQSRPGSTFGMVGANGTAAYADIDSGVAIAVMRNHTLGGFSTAAAIDDLVTDHFR